MSEITPISIRVARWAALAAAITAFGSIFSTIWTDRPWWTVPAPSSVVVPTNLAPAGTGELKVKDSLTIKKQEMIVLAPVPTAAMEVTGINEYNHRFWDNIEHRPFTKWIIILSLSFGPAYLLTEYLHHRREKLKLRPPTS